MNSFPCYQCGLCCQHIDLAAETKYLDRGDGTCRNYETLTKSCGIYDQRPDICRVDKQYILRYAKHYKWNEFVALNLEVCARLDILNSHKRKVKVLGETSKNI